MPPPRKINSLLFASFVPKSYSKSWIFLCRLVPLVLLAIYSFAIVSQLPQNPFPVSVRAQSLKNSSVPDVEGRRKLLCSALIDGDSSGRDPGTKFDEGFLCCDRSNPRTDVCYMRGDIRTHPSSPSTIFVNNVPANSAAGAIAEKIKPYTRKFEDGVMSTISELTLDTAAGEELECEVVHGEVPALVFSTGGYTENLYHAFSDGLIPLYITSERFRGEVVFVVQEFQDWWAVRYGGVLREMSNYPVVDLADDRRVHCFKEMIVGLKYHGELLINPALMPNGKGMNDFQALLRRGFSKSAMLAQEQDYDDDNALLPQPLLDYQPANLCSDEQHEPGGSTQGRPKIVIFVRKQTRLFMNLRDVVKACKRAGFLVRTFDARRSIPLYQIHNTLASANAMLAIHGAAVTHFLFLRPGSVLIQIVPLGLDWASETFYGAPAKRLGLEYIEYKIMVNESSLSEEYRPGSPELVDPGTIAKQGWWEMKKIYMDKQNVKLDVKRLDKYLHKAYALVLQNSCNVSNQRTA